MQPLMTCLKKFQASQAKSSRARPSSKVCLWAAVQSVKEVCWLAQIQKISSFILTQEKISAIVQLTGLLILSPWYQTMSLIHLFSYLDIFGEISADKSMYYVITKVELAFI